MHYGGLLELGTKGLYERKVAVPDTRFRLYNAYWRIGRSGLSMAFPFSTNYRLARLDVDGLRGARGRGVHPLAWKGVLGSSPSKSLRQ